MLSSDNSSVQIPLSRGYTALVDPVDADLLDQKWCIRANGDRYAGRTIWIEDYTHCKSVLMHCVVLERVLERDLLPGEVVDHINGNTLDNRRSNLRVATYSQNNQNSRRSARNSSGYKGVSWRKNANKWRAYITHEHNQIHLGYFDTPEEAHDVYCKAARELFGEFAKAN